MIYTDITECKGNGYGILYADPPWEYECIKEDKEAFSNGLAVQKHYATMGNEEIKQMPIDDISAKNALLFVWVTSPLLDVGIEVIKAWGFEFKTVAFVWYKHLLNAGYYTMSQCELVLVAKKGNIPTPRGARNVRQLISEKRTEHSRKPNEARWRIEEMFPTQKKIELFARKINKGWDQFGNQVDKYGEERDYFIGDLF